MKSNRNSKLNGLIFKLMILFALCCVGCGSDREIYEVNPGLLDTYDSNGFFEMKWSWKRGLILESRSINILGKEYCVDIVRDWRLAKAGFIQFDDADNIPTNLWICTEKYSAYAFEDNLIFVGIAKPEGFSLPVCNQPK